MTLQILLSVTITYCEDVSYGRISKVTRPRRWSLRDEEKTDDRVPKKMMISITAKIFFGTDSALFRSIFGVIFQAKPAFTSCYIHYLQPVILTRPYTALSSKLPPRAPKAVDTVPKQKSACRSPAELLNQCHLTLQQQRSNLAAAPF